MMKNKFPAGRGRTRHIIANDVGNSIPPTIPEAKPIMKGSMIVRPSPRQGAKLVGGVSEILK
jgi:hypothetical protein